MWPLNIHFRHSNAQFGLGKWYSFDGFFFFLIWNEFSVLFRNLWLSSACCLLPFNLWFHVYIRVRIKVESCENRRRYLENSLKFQNLLNVKGMVSARERVSVCVCLFTNLCINLTIFFDSHLELSTYHGSHSSHSN